MRGGSGSPAVACRRQRTAVERFIRVVAAKSGSRSRNQPSCAPSVKTELNARAGNLQSFAHRISTKPFSVQELIEPIKRAAGKNIQSPLALNEKDLLAF